MFPTLAISMFVLAASGAASQDEAKPRLALARVFGDHMVLQRDLPIRLWGRGTTGAEIRVSFAGKEESTRVGSDGGWKLELPPVAGSAKPRRLTATARHGGRERTVTLEDVVCGDVWVCSGQSNMRWRLRQSEGGEKAARVADLPNLRLLDFEGTLYPSGRLFPEDSLRALTPQTYYRTDGWNRCSSKAAQFSAVAFFFGRKLVRELDVPIGLIHNAIGGAPMESFVPRSAAARDRHLAALFDEWWTHPDYHPWCRKRVRENLGSRCSEAEVRKLHPFAPAFLFEAGIRPLASLRVKGVLWYQGESNAGADARVSRRLFETLIGSWRTAFERPDLPFYFVQLPGFRRDWPRFREAQLEVAREVAHTGMVVTTDVGDPGDVHPRRKRPVGERLARLALVQTYGRAGLATGPLYSAHAVEGDAVAIRFEESDGLRSSDGRPLRGFEIAGRDRRFHPAAARIDGSRVLVRAAAVSRPIAVRFGFANDPDTNLVNEAGLPASPFRTDRWRYQPQGPKPGEESFESARVGAITDWSSAVGRWTSGGGAAITDRFARTGKRCLNLQGGDGSHATLELRDHQGVELTFWAERWTRRAPFRFRITSEDGGKRRELFVGDRELRVGRRFLSHVVVPVPEGVRRLRFECASPPKTGVLIDDVTVVRVPKKRVVRARNVAWTVPALHGKEDNPVAKSVIESRGGAQPATLEAITVRIPEATRLSDIGSVAIELGSKRFGKRQEAQRELTFRGAQKLSSGANEVFVVLELTKEASLDRRVAVTFASLKLEGEDKPIAFEPGVSEQRVGVTVRAAGQDGTHTYRIPGLATSNDGTLIAVYDCRHKGSRDLPGDIDVGTSRSVDGGRTWEPRRIIMDMGSDPKWRFDGIGDPSVLVDRKTGSILVAATWSHGNRSWNGSGPGLTPEATGQFLLTKSDDDGVTWSKPRNITRQIKDPAWRFVLAGPGKGITMRDGTLVFPAQFRSANESEYEGKPFSTVIWSKDRGRTWKIGSGVRVDTTESQVVELADGSLMINCRDNRRGARSIYTTEDLGETWREHPTSRGALIEPTCMASLIRVVHEKHGPLLFFSNPASRSSRHHMTLKVSRDEGRTWPAHRHVLYDERRGFGYSCLTRIGGDRVGVLYEGERELFFLRFSLEELIR